MPLIEILSNLAAELGTRISEPTERAWLISQINAASKDFYASNDFFGCEREQIVTIDPNQQQISLPYYVQKVIAVRDYSTRYPFTQEDMRPRYLRNTWLRPFMGFPYYRWRIKSEDYPIQTDITNAGLLTVSIPSASSTLFSVIITGGTANATREQEVLTFPADGTTTTLTTTKLFQTIESIRKSSPTELDVTIQDLDGNILAVIPNTELYTQYTIVQLLDRLEYRSEVLLAEVLFKQRFNALVNDYDMYPCGSAYDQCFFFKTLSRIYGLRGDFDKARVYSDKAEADAALIVMNREGPIDKRINFGSNKTMETFTKLGQSYVTGNIRVLNVGRIDR